MGSKGGGDASLLFSEEQIRAHTIGEVQPFSCRILIVDYDPQWRELFQREASRIRAVLGCRTLRVEHTGSTSVPGLAVGAEGLIPPSYGLTSGFVPGSFELRAVSLVISQLPF